MIYYYFQQLIQFAQHNSIMFASIVIISFVAIFILTILLLNPKKENLNDDSIQTDPHRSLSPNALIRDRDDSSLQSISPDMSSIAGEDICVTQLDLARAYIELNKVTLAKQILENVIQQGDRDQQQAAQELLLTL
jgi:FimV-like protein